MIAPFQGLTQGSRIIAFITADRWGHVYSSCSPISEDNSHRTEPEQEADDTVEEVNKPVENPEEKQNLVNYATDFLVTPYLWTHPGISCICHFIRIHNFMPYLEK